MLIPLTGQEGVEARAESGKSSRGRLWRFSVCLVSNKAGLKLRIKMWLQMDDPY